MCPKSPATKRKNKRWQRILLISGGSIILLLTVGWFVLNAYINNHKQQLLEDITTKISANISGNLQIKNMQPALFASFPNISVRLDSVSLTDSLYDEHHIKTAELKFIYVKFSIFSLLSLHPKIRKITLSDGAIHLFVLKNGYSNLYLFENNKKQQGQSPKKNTAIHLFGAQNVTFTFSQIPHNKRFKLHCNRIKLNIKHHKNQLLFKTNLNLFINQLGFNLSKGSYLQNKEIRGKIKITYDLQKQALNINNQELNINGNPVQITTTFNFAPDAQNFNLRLNAPKIAYHDAISFLPDTIFHKLKKIKAKNTIAVEALLSGGFDYPDTPHVTVNIRAKQNTVMTPYGKFSKANFEAVFNNYIKKGLGKGDENSGIFVPYLKGEWMGIPLQVDSAAVYNLVHPLLNIKIKGTTPAVKLNKILGKSFSVKKGNVQFKLAYRGPVKAADTFSGNLDGILKIDNAGFIYLPRNLNFSNCKALLAFTGNRLYIKNMALKMGGSDIQIHGEGKNFLNAYLSGKGNALFDCRLTSKKLDLNRLKPLLSPRNRFSPYNHKRNKNINKFNYKLDMLLKNSMMLLHFDIQKATYKNFAAQQIHGDLDFQKQTITFKNVSLKNSGGNISFDATLRQNKSNNQFSLNAGLQHLAINQLFHSFNNFGQNTLQAKNLSGRLNATTGISGLLNKNAGLVSQSLSGHINFKITNGALINFPPFLKISRFAFKNRNLDSITFKTLKDKFTIQSGKVYIPPLAISSSAIYMTVQGVYAFKKGTDISLKIPLRNPKKDKERIARGLKPRRNKGIVLYLRAKDGADGKVHIGWDPFHKLEMKDSGKTTFDKAPKGK